LSLNAFLNEKNVLKIQGLSISSIFATNGDGPYFEKLHGGFVWADLNP